jgi:hypothetical protein
VDDAQLHAFADVDLEQRVFEGFHGTGHVTLEDEVEGVDLAFGDGLVEVFQADALAALGQGGVAVGSFEGYDALILTEGDYVTYLYCREGKLCVLYMEEGTGLSAADGVAVLPLQALAVKRDGDIVLITVTDEDGEPRNLAVVPRSGVKEEGGL